jgi:putative transposase
MKKARRSPEQIVEILRQVEAGKAAGKPVAQLCKEAGVGEWTYYRWRKQYQGMSEPDAKRLKELERENARLKKLLAEKELDNSILKEALEGNY